jgi:molybdopterin synthase sulfur carrier subunit
MAVLRLFAAAREAAGEARVELDGTTVGDVLDQARSRYGSAFGSVLDRSRVWVNGQPTELSAAIGAHDVVAVLPPVSGGAGGTAAAVPPPPAPPAPPPPPPREAYRPDFGLFPEPDAGRDLGEMPEFPPLPDLDVPSGTGREPEEWSHDAKFEALPAADQSSADDLLDRLAGLPPFPAGDPVFGEADEPPREPLFPEPPEEVAGEGERTGWDPNRDASWSVGDPTPPPEPRGPEPGGEPERDLWSWPEGEGEGEAPDADDPDARSPFAPEPAPPPPSDWDKRIEPPAGEARSEADGPRDSLGQMEERPGGGSRAVPFAIVDEPAVRILGGEAVVRPASPPPDRGDEPAVRIIGPNRPPTAGDPPRTNGSSSPPGAPPPLSSDAARRAHAVGVLVDQAPDTLLRAREVRMAPPGGGEAGGSTATATLVTAPAPSAGSAATAGPATAALSAPEPAPAKVKQPPPPLAVIPKASRPHGRLGFLWVGVTVGAVVTGPELAGVWLAACAGVAGLHTAKVWRSRGERPVQLLAGAIAAALPLCAIWGVRAITGAVVAAVVVTLLARLFALTKAPARDVGLTLAIGVLIGLGVASVVLLRNINIHAPLLLLALTAAYDAGAYLVGTGASSTWEGPVAGVLALIPVTMLSAVVSVPPFADGSPLLLGVLAGALAPCGPLAGSALLGERDAHAPALRRLDSLLVLGPVWAWCAAAFLN